MLARYERLLARRPLVVKTVLGGTIACCGDATAQKIQRSRSSHAAQQPYDKRRGLALTSLGTVWNGPFLHYYFNALDRRFPPSGGKFRAMLLKTGVNQLIMNPFVYLPLFYLWTGTVAGRSSDQIIDKATREYKPSLYATWLIFTPVNVGNFYFVPLRHQTAVNVCVSFVYNTTLSIIGAPREEDVR